MENARGTRLGDDQYAPRGVGGEHPGDFLLPASLTAATRQRNDALAAELSPAGLNGCRDLNHNCRLFIWGWAEDK